MEEGKEMDQYPETAIVPRSQGGAMTVDELREHMAFEAARIEETKAFVEKCMTEGVHYGTIPGTKKPTLYQPGAQIMAGIYGYAASYGIAEVYEPERTKRWQRQLKKWDRGKKKMVTVYDAETDKAVMEDIVTTGRYEVTVTCTLTHKGSGVVVGQGIGSCNSWEKKYAALDVDDVKNTVLKVGKKRAYNDAVMTACRLSDFFSVDVEDATDAAALGIEIDLGDAEHANQEVTRSSQTATRSAHKTPEEKAVTGHVPNPYVGKLASVEVLRSDTNERGPWRLWGITTAGNNTFKTFTDGPAAVCKKALADGATVRIEWKLNDRKDMMLEKASVVKP